ncbi:hypothetical protein [Dactylosporangium sp. CA-139066]|uniref:hypothetical protein n=1 Tax=Dactylosporangium sp. CA-139066 TaxID=3239930 RepID=UPI003D8F436F
MVQPRLIAPHVGVVEREACRNLCMNSMRNLVGQLARTAQSIEHERFVARFPDHGLDLEQLQDQDIYVILMTLDAIDTVLRRRAQTGEAAGGNYFWSTDLIIVPGPGITAMIEAIDGLVRDEKIGQACQVIRGPDDGPDVAPWQHT